MIEDDPYLGELAPLALVKSLDEDKESAEPDTEVEEPVIFDPLSPPEPDSKPKETPGPDAKNSKPSNLTLGMQAMTAGNVGQAKYYLAAAKNEDGDNSSQLFTLIGSVAMAEGAVSRAITSFSKAIELDDANEAAFWARSEALRRLGRIDEAMRDLQRAQELSPTSTLFSNKIYLLRLEKGEVEEIKKELQEKKELGLESLEASWLGADAAVAFMSENFDEGINQLAKLQTKSSASDFRLIISDRVILFFASNPSVRNFLAQYAKERTPFTNPETEAINAKVTEQNN
ncbi:MAG: tetratricopeptide repeat protein [Chthoniobacterales bacterium]